ncbi:response regulator transcription factor [Actinoplanes sp. N902-109]|uniref:response regulator transcription factor n=1 Tax=Actinoplanes sp. (strain N902-109) TaxID=649831 RepID=UPI000329580F|nr:response regulator [Actinoplanes sp. N902-109]AGL16517.1 winged helix family two component transcriptional regulator [Actinoplanes sp. N902-109]
MATVLVVDDEPDIRDLLVKRLGQDGHLVLPADGGAEALALVESRGVPDAVVLDLDMPGMDGFELLERLRGRHPQLPVLIVSVLWADDVHERVRHLSADFLAKPFTAAALTAGVRQLLGLPSRGDDAGVGRR